MLSSSKAGECCKQPEAAEHWWNDEDNFQTPPSKSAAVRGSQAPGDHEQDLHHCHTATLSCEGGAQVVAAAPRTPSVAISSIYLLSKT